MTLLAALESIPLEVVPGESLTCGLTIRNNSDVVDAYQFEVVGVPAPWTLVEPANPSLYPGTEMTVAVRFQPPRSSQAPAGETPFAVRVQPVQRPQDAVAPEGVLNVLPFTATTAEITPRTSKGRRRAKHEVAIDNRGNVPVTANLAGADPDGQLAVRPRPAAVVVGPGRAEFATIGLRHRRRLWRGAPVTRPFQVTVDTQADPPIRLDAGTVQVPIIPRGAGRVAALAALLALLLVGAWFLLLKPAVTSAAEEAVEQPLTQISQRADDAKQKADKAADTAEQARTASGGNAPANAATPGPVAATPARAAGTVPVTVRLQTSLAASSTPGTNSFTVPARTTLVVTDLVLQNPQGDTGRVDVVVDGTTILTLSLANFRDLDYHFVSPIQVPAGKTLAIRTTCQSPGPAIVGTSGSRCRVSMFATGVKRVAAA
jgi:hypothetical protein